MLAAETSPEISRDVHMDGASILHGDALERTRELPDACIDALCTDPPYGLSKPPPLADLLASWLRGEEWIPTGRGFMGRAWDAAVPCPAVWREALRVCKPGAHAVVFAGDRTAHLMAVSCLLGGWELRHLGVWVSAQCFPKSLDLGEGRGTALKTIEPWLLLRKPLSEKTLISNVAKWGTGGLNIDACRLPLSAGATKTINRYPGVDPMTGLRGVTHAGDSYASEDTAQGRWPSALVLDGEPDWSEVEGVVSALGDFVGYVDKFAIPTLIVAPKANGRERDAGLEDMPTRTRAEVTGRDEESAGIRHPRAGVCGKERKNTHTTVKPIALMRHLVRLITPVDGVVLDPFCGSGSTGVAAAYERRGFVGVELNDSEAEPYVTIAKGRIEHALRTR